MVGKTFIVDLDDTLIKTQTYYDFALIHLLECVIPALGEESPGVRAIIQTVTEIDGARVREHGFGDAKRLAGSYVLAYKKLCEDARMKPSGEIIDKVYKIGMVPTNPETYKNIKLMSGVKETLDFLVEQDDELILYTRGPDKTQKAKIQAPHLDRWFKEQHIVNDKNGAVLSKIVSSRQKEKCCSVGDYLDCDILPALEIGIKAIYIPSNSGWLETGITKSLMANPGFLRFREILEIKQHYGKL